MNVFTETDIQCRRKQVADAFAGELNDDDILLIFSGNPMQKPGGLDQCYPFLPHPDYYWITGSRRAGGVSAYSKINGWLDFVTPVSKSELLWEGQQTEMLGLDVNTLEAHLTAAKPRQVYGLGQAGVEQIQRFKLVVDPALQETWNRQRRLKDPAEIKLIKRCAKAAAEGYQHLQNLIKPGITERFLQIEYEAKAYAAGADKMPYDTIVGSGPNAATLHAIPTQRIIQPGDLILIDAGADIADYCVDVTRVFFANGQPSGRQRDVYDIVQSAQTAAIKLCQPKIRWQDVHRAAATEIAQGLKDLSLLTGNIDHLVESGAVSLFFPHGVGHMVGQRVRDVGGVAGATPTACCGIHLRFDVPLETNFVVTVEPGIYFVKPLLQSSDSRSKFKDQVAWTKLAEWCDFGGVRIEDNIRVATEPENLTVNIPKPNW